MQELRDPLVQGAAALDVPLDDTQATHLLDYLGLLAKWGGVYNLTAVRAPREMLHHHLLDSLAVVAPLRRHLQGRGREGGAVLDVGAGAGLPGVVLAVCLPLLQVRCVDTVAKKAAFVQQVAGALRLPNLQGIHARVEKLQGAYDVITSRAFASLGDFTRLSSSLLGPEGVWMAMKGREPTDEIAELAPGVVVFHVEQLQVPGLDAQRCLVWMRPRPSV